MSKCLSPRQLVRVERVFLQTGKRTRKSFDSADEKFMLSANSNTQFNSRTRCNLSDLNEDVSLFSKKERETERGVEYQWLRSKRIRGEFNHVAFRARESAGNKRKVRARPLWESNRRGAHQLQIHGKKDHRVTRAMTEISI